MQRRMLTGAASAAALIFVFGTGSAQAAPQALALVETDEPVTLTCEGGTCAAEFSAFCLQPERYAPRSGTPYHVAGDTRVTVTVQTADGRAIDLNAGDVLKFHSVRGHTAVRISLPEAALGDGGGTVQVAVADNVTLAPDPVPGDDNPISANEIELVGDALRPLGSMLVDRNSEGMAAARVANRLVNAIPDYDGEPQRTKSLWNRYLTAAKTRGLSHMAERLANNAFELCDYYSSRVVQGAMRSCMQGQHDRLMKVLNSNYWKAVKTGS